MSPVTATPGKPVTPHNMPFTAHLAELRRRLLVCLATVMLSTGLSFYFAKPLIQALQKLTPEGTLFVQLTPGEVFLSTFKFSVMAGIGLSLPVILYQVIRFISPGLEGKERRLVIPLVALGFALFMAGIAFGYGVILPAMLHFLLDYGSEFAQNQLSFASFLDFCGGFIFASGLTFQVPLFLLFASLIGFTSSSALLAQWKWAVVACFLLGAIVTPSPDPFSQLLMAGCLFGLYGVSVGLIKIFGK